MSIFNIKSTVIAGRDASPKVLQEDLLARGSVKSAFGVQKVSPAGSDLNAAGTQIRLITVPSNARLDSLDYAGTSCGTSTLDVAVWFPTYLPQGGMVNSGMVAAALISSSAFASNLNIPDTNQAFTTAMPAFTVVSLAQREQPLWQLLGLSQDPGVSLDLGFAVRSACAINGYVGLHARFVD